MVQWLRIHLPTQGTRVPSLIWEDPACKRAHLPYTTTTELMCLKPEHQPEESDSRGRWCFEWGDDGSLGKSHLLKDLEAGVRQRKDGCVFMEKERDGAASQGRQPVDGKKDGDQCFPTCSHCSRHIPSTPEYHCTLLTYHFSLFFKIR